MGLHLLFVCTGNIYRSPMAEGFTRAEAKERGIDASASSAGILEGDRLIASAAASAIERADPSMLGHRSRLLQADDIRSADVVMGLAREHVRHVVVLEPDAWSRAFTLKELVRRGEAIGARGAGQSVADWLEGVGAGRIRADLLGSSPLDDVPDPVGASVSAVRDVAREIRSLVRQLLDLLLPLPLLG